MCTLAASSSAAGAFVMKGERAGKAVTRRGSGVPRVCRRMASRSSPSSSTTAPAASPNSTQVVRSVQSTTGDRASAATTSIFLTRPLLKKAPATSSAYIKPEHAALTSIAGQWAPSRPCRRHAIEGDMTSPRMVAQRMKSSSSGLTPASSIAFSAASRARSVSVSELRTRRSFTPVRVVIHSSLVSTMRDKSSLVTTSLGSALPVPLIVKLIMPPD